MQNTGGTRTIGYVTVVLLWDHAIVFGLVGCDCMIYGQESNSFCSCWNCCILMSATTNGATNSHYREYTCNAEACCIWWLKATVLELSDIVHVWPIPVVCQNHKFQQYAEATHRITINIIGFGSWIWMNGGPIAETW